MSLQQTPLFRRHVELGGRMVPFAGWEMPVQYSSIIEEHMAVRERAGLFDVSHMGEIIVSGPRATEFLDSVTCNDVASIKMGQVQYNAVLNEHGGLVDDITIYRLGAEEFFVVSNASNYPAVAAHFQQHAPTGVVIDNQSTSWHQIAIQGPLAEKILCTLIGKEPESIFYYRFSDLSWKGQRLRVSRTGYTGEDGFEIYSPIDVGLVLWDALLDAGRPFGLLPAGLGARDSLRLEARFPLYGHELNTEWSPVESGIGWIVKEKARPFLGSVRILDHKKNSPPGRVCGFRLTAPGMARDGYSVLVAGKPVAKVLSGAHSPVLKASIGTVYLPAAHLDAKDLTVEIREKQISAEIVTGPFVKGTAGAKKAPVGA